MISRRSVSLLAFALAVFAYGLGLWFELPALRLWAKPVPAIALAAWIAGAPAAGLVTAALLFSTLGDLALELDPAPRFFMTGMAAFAAAHVAYIAAFLRRAPRLRPIVLAPFLLWGAVLLRLTWAGLGPLTVPVCLYAALLLAMMWRAAVAALDTGRWGTVVGAVLFGLSDSLIALDRFRAPVPGGRWLVMALYWTGQLGLATFALDAPARRRLAPPSAALLILVLCAAARADAEGAAVVVRVLDVAGRPRPEARIVANCPDGRAWRATTDARGFAALADVPPCPLTVEAVDQEEAVRIQVERLDVRAIAVLDAAFARDLPSSRNPWSQLETVEPAAILDRIDGAGLHLGEPGRFSMRGASWTQNALRWDGVDLTDPLNGGLPLAEPDLDVLERIEVVSGLAPADQSGAGVTMAFVPLAPSSSWRGSVRADALGSALQQAPKPDAAPPIARFGSLADLRAFASGPVATRARILLSGRYAHVGRSERDEAAEREATHAAGSGQLLRDFGERDSLRLHVAAQTVRRPLLAPFLGSAPREAVDAVGVQGRWTRAGERGSATAFAGLVAARFEPQGNGATRPVERLRDGPVPELILPAGSRRTTWTAGLTFARPASPIGKLWHAPRIGATLDRASVRDRAGGAVAIAETVDGLPARVWEYAWPGPDSVRHAWSAAAWAADRIGLRDRMFLEAGLRFAAARGAAEGAAQGVSWTTFSPRLAARIRLAEWSRLSLFGGYADYAHRLLLAPLAFGDPNGPQAEVFRWTDANGDGRFDPAERGVLVSRVGPGAPDGALAAIDPDLRPPRTREVVLGLEASPGGSRVRLTGFDRRERDLVDSVDVGAPPSSYTVRLLPDPAGDIVGAQDDQLLPVYDRKPESFGLDRYLLTNPSDHAGLHQAVELRIERDVGRVALQAGATASRTEIRGGNRGFRVTENDQGLLGELHDDPNADTHADGRGFFDRAYTVKIAAAYRAPGDWRFGAVARYQDGQPFNRVVVVPDLAQGPEAVAATPRGQVFRGAVDDAGRYLVPSGHRFTYTLTVDVRVGKDLALGGRRRLGLAVEVFNLLGARNEVEEDPVSGPRFRTPTALQPPRVARLGLRLDF
ncbi:MAG TPA: lysoplasmalogenase family protein [Vicinamibacteria bacterium]|nr:lysoplasmalogenase family protein [Vicinamibacteria bacterium]